MANLFESAIKGFFGQQDVPEQNYLSSSDIAGSVAAAAPGIGAANLAYNQAMAPGMARLNRQVEDIYDPNQGNLREATTKSILEQLGLGGELPPDVQAAVLRAGFEKGQAGGIAGTRGGRNLVGRDLGLTSLDLLNKRIGTAAQYTRSAPTGSQLYQTQDIGFKPSDVASIDIANNNARNQAALYKAQVEARNARNLWEAPMNLGIKAWGGYQGKDIGNTEYAKAPSNMNGNTGSPEGNMWAGGDYGGGADYGGAASGGGAGGGMMFA